MGLRSRDRGKERDSQISIFKKRVLVVASIRENMRLVIGKQTYPSYVQCNISAKLEMSFFTAVAIFQAREIVSKALIWLSMVRGREGDDEDDESRSIFDLTK